MDPARQTPFGTSQRQRQDEPIDAETVNTAIQVVAAWLIAFACVSAIALLS